MDNVYIYNRFVSDKKVSLVEIVFSLKQGVSNLNVALQMLGIQAVRAYSDLGYDNEVFNKMVDEIPNGSTLAMAEIVQVGDLSCLEKLSKKDIKIIVIEDILKNSPNLYYSREIYEDYINSAV